MTLFQLLSKFNTLTSLIIFDMKGNQIISVKHKDEIPISLYDEQIFSIDAGLIDHHGNNILQGCLYVTLVK